VSAFPRVDAIDHAGLYAGRTYRSISRHGSRLTELFTLITHECQTPESIIGVTGTRSVVVDDWAFAATGKAGGPSLIYSRSWSKSKFEQVPLFARFRSLLGGNRHAGMVVQGAPDNCAVEVELTRRMQAYERWGTPVRPGDPWASSSASYDEYGGYVVVESRDSWTEGIYFGVSPAKLDEEKGPDALSMKFVASFTASLSGSTVMDSGPRRTGHHVGGLGATYPWTKEMGRQTKVAVALPSQHPECSGPISQLLADD